MLADLRRAGIEVSREQERFALAGGWLRGKIDAVGRGFLEAPKAEHVVEIKSMKAAAGARCRSTAVAKAKPEHWHQLHAGMAALGIARGAYVVANKDDEQSSSSASTSTSRRPTARRRGSSGWSPSTRRR